MQWIFSVISFTAVYIFIWNKLSSLPRVFSLWCEADHSLPSSAKIKSEWSYTSTSPYIFMVVLN